MDGRGRRGALSHATVVALPSKVHADGWDIVLPPRSHRVATHANFNHVAPSGILAPFDEDAAKSADEFGVRRNFYREFVEELYAEARYERPEYFGNDDPADDKAVDRLTRLFDDGLAQLYYTGISINLLTVRHEICLLLKINDPEWLRREETLATAAGSRLHLGWEWAQSSEDVQSITPDQPSHWRFGITSDLQPVAAPLDRVYTIPNAAAAIYLALPVLQATAEREA